MVVVAFLQNLWVEHPRRVQKFLGAAVDTRRSEFIRRVLFAGGLTGKRLLATFGKDICDQIVWDEASPVVVGDSKTICKPDSYHIVRVLSRWEPDMVLTFGVLAGDAVKKVWVGEMLRAPHPAARQRESRKNLQKVAAIARQRIEAANGKLGP